MKTPLVSICSITYNHAPFIRQCLDSFLMQQCSFPIEIIINDDCSTDGTTEIIREYAEKYPDKIFPIFHKENLYSQGVRGLFLKFVYPKARGKYIAICEGDDYWTDPLKLQKQVDFLESHPDFSMCFHRVRVKTDGIRKRIDSFDKLIEREYSADEIVSDWLVPTATVMFRRNISIPWHKDFRVADIVIFTACLAKGRAYCLDKEMAVYRLHSGGWTNPTLRKTDTDWTRLLHLLALLEKFPRTAVKKVKEKASLLCIFCILALLKDNNIKQLKHLPRAIYYCNTKLFSSFCFLFLRYIKNRNSNNK